MNSTRSQSETQCRKCGYNLKGLSAVASCPECGEADAAVSPLPLHYRPWLHRYAMLFVCMTFGLLMLGGTVTSKGVGLAVPDWPTTFDYNMFLFPPSQWVGGVFWEHTHRLMGSLVGLMAIGMAVWLWRTQKRNRGGQNWLRMFGVVTLLVVIGQGVMGGLRVTELSVAFAVFHGITAQLFLCMTILIAAATSRWWIERDTTANQATSTNSAGRMKLAYTVLGIVIIQLVLGATMRHNGAGLAIPDFPAMYGSALPPFDSAGIESAMNRHTGDDYSAAPNVYYTTSHVAIHFAHRAWAVVVTIALLALAFKLFRGQERHPLVTRSMAIVLMTLAVQIGLGAWVIWSTRHPEVATAHQAMGAVLLGNLFLMVARMRRLPMPIEDAGRIQANERSAQPGYGLEAVQA